MSWGIARWWLAGLTAYVIFLLATFPAAYALALLQKRLPDAQLANVSGSIWSGAAQEFALHGQSWGALQWHFDWRAPFVGRLGYRLQLRGPEIALQGQVAGNRNKLLLEDVRGHLPLSRLESWLPLPTGSVNGKLDLHLSQVLLVKLRPERADGSVNLTGVSLSWPQALTLGDYQLKLQTQAQNGIHGSFVDTGGPLVLQGTLDLGSNGHYQVSGTLTSRDPGNAALNTLLRGLPVDGSGHHPFHFTGQW